MIFDRYERVEAERLIPALAKGGRFSVLDHCSKRLAERGITLPDVLNVLCAGIVDEAHLENRGWRHKVWTGRLEVVVEIQGYPPDEEGVDERELVVITAWRTR